MEMIYKQKQVINKLVCCTLATITLFVTGCADPNITGITNQEIGTETGAVIGGATAYKITEDQDNNDLEVMGGTVLGAIVGSAVGAAMDRHDQVMAQNAITDVPLYQDTTWSNDDTGATYTVTSYKEFKKGATVCRTAKMTLRSRDRIQNSEATLCRHDGKWYSA